MNTSTLSIKNSKGEYKRFKVEEEVYVYVRQLECCIKYPNDSKLKDKYKDTNRFK